eukprot:4666781-Pleurochrysis_carterae.AAC.1
MGCVIAMRIRASATMRKKYRLSEHVYALNVSWYTLDVKSIVSPNSDMSRVKRRFDIMPEAAAFDALQHQGALGEHMIP